MSDHLDDLDPELAALYATERASPLPPDATARVLAGVLTTITATTVATAAAKAAGGQAAARAARTLSFKAALVIAVAGAIAGGLAVAGYGQLTAAPPEQRSTPQPAPVPPPGDPAPSPLDTPAPSITVDAAIDVPVDAPTHRPTTAPAGRPAPRAPDVASGAAPSPDDGDTREPLLIDRARTALRRGFVDDALATLMSHERLHPTGSLAEERDVLVIEAYVAKHEAALARRRIERYRRDHPDGFLRARVDAAEAALVGSP